MITILLTNDQVRRWDKTEYTEYDINGRFFVIIREKQWVGMYALDNIVSVEVEDG